MKTALHARLMGTFLVAITVLAGMALLIHVHARATAETYQTRLTDLVKVVELTRAADQGVKVLERLATGPSSDAAVAEFQPVKDQIHQLRLDLASLKMNQSLALAVQYLDNMANSFLVEAAAATYAYHDKDLERFFKHDREAALIAGYIRDTADRLVAAELDAYRQSSPELVRRDQVLQNTNLAILVVVTLLAILFSWSFARGVTDPLRALTSAASRIAAGNLSGPPVPTGAGAELEILGNSFNQMQENLRQRVTELQEKAELERRLQAEELENLQVHSLLREAELRALQSQVNPHFLFNTLNMVAKTALIEGADRTRGLLETVADLLRYSLRQLDRPVTLADEVDQVRRYMAIQAERFRERFRFFIDSDGPALMTPIPCLTLQPLVENALIHGLGSLERGGSISLTIRREGAWVRVAVSDDGIGITPERLAELTEGRLTPAGASGHTTGLGLGSVRRRLQLFYDDRAELTIQTQAGRGTTVQINVPAPVEGGGLDAHSGGR